MDSTHFLFRQGKVYHIRYVMSIQVWGIRCHLSSSGFYHNLLRADEINSTLSFLYNNQSSGVGLDYMLIWKRES